MRQTKSADCAALLMRENNRRKRPRRAVYSLDCQSLFAVVVRGVITGLPFSLLLTMYGQILTRQPGVFARAVSGHAIHLPVICFEANSVAMRMPYFPIQIWA